MYVWAEDLGRRLEKKLGRCGRKLSCENENLYLEKEKKTHYENTVASKSMPLTEKLI